jgi:predicted nuclease with TOPRIM domain
MTTDTPSRRQAALDALMPAWSELRRRVFDIGSALKDLKAEHQQARERLARTEADLEHAAACRLSACLRCEEIALNGADG